VVRYSLGLAGVAQDTGAQGRECGGPVEASCRRWLGGLLPTSAAGKSFPCGVVELPLWGGVVALREIHTVGDVSGQRHALQQLPISSTIEKKVI
jgi:hypothetical protein